MVTVDENIMNFFNDSEKNVVSFLGYSGAGYEYPGNMLDIARGILEEFSPETTIINIGATAEGIGAVYKLASELGFTTTGIVSTQARDYSVPASPYVDHVFYVTDDLWGGFMDESGLLSPTSAAMVEYSDLLVAIGGGDVAFAELTSAIKAGKEVRIFAADMNHEKTRIKAFKNGLPEPTDFAGRIRELLNRQS